MIKKLTVAIVAHVDSGKTSLSESILFHTGTIRKQGRVDKGDAFLDTDLLEKERGITIFSKQAVFRIADTEFTLLDTPGHVDFSAETERVFGVIDAAILVINGSDGVQSHTGTLLRLLSRYKVPVFIFVNKMDRPDVTEEKLLRNLQKHMGPGAVSFAGLSEKSISLWPEETKEGIALCDDDLTEQYLDSGDLSEEQVKELIAERKLYPVWFGSALKDFGVEEFLQGLERFISPRKDLKEVSEFGAKVYKISRDKNGVRLTHLRIMSGKLTVRDVITFETTEGTVTEKISRIRRYNGASFEEIPEAETGTVCAVTGLTFTRSGESIGDAENIPVPCLEPVLSYRVILPEDTDPVVAWQKLSVISEEEPDLQIEWEETKKEIRVKLMGEIQLQVLQKRISERFGYDVSFGESSVVYKETITETVEGVGHYEPLRHYAEAHILLKPGKPGSGILCSADCREDVLDKNWQRLILTHLKEKQHKGVLIGAPLTDTQLVVVTGKAHLKHTEGGDFRQSTYRAVRQGLMSTKCRVLEPYYDFELVVPPELTGRAMTDLERMKAKDYTPETEEERTVIRGYGPVSTLQSYQTSVQSYSKGLGHISFSFREYGPCHNEEEIIKLFGYEPERDTENSPDSVFCDHGAGFVVPWNEVPDYMHVPYVFKK